MCVRLFGEIPCPWNRRITLSCTGPEPDGRGVIRRWTTLSIIIIIIELRWGSCLGCCLDSGWLNRNNYIECTYLVRIVAGLKSISTCIDVCEEGVNRLRDLRQKVLLLDKGGRVMLVMYVQLSGSDTLSCAGFRILWNHKTKVLLEQIR